MNRAGICIAPFASAALLAGCASAPVPSVDCPRIEDPPDELLADCPDELAVPEANQQDALISARIESAERLAECHRHDQGWIDYYATHVAGYTCELDD